jgi:hypothetical protein
VSWIVSWIVFWIVSMGRRPSMIFHDHWNLFLNVHWFWSKKTKKEMVKIRKMNFKPDLIALTLQRALCGRLAPLLGMGLDL